MSIISSSPRRYRKVLAGAAAAVAVGGLAAGCGSSNTTATATPAGATSSAGSSAQGGAPSGGFGTTVTGAAADKAKAAALAKYPGTVERVMKLSDGSYVVHVMRSSGGEVHVEVSKAFAVTGIEQGLPGGAPSGGAPPAAGGTTTES